MRIETKGPPPCVSLGPTFPDFNGGYVKIGIVLSRADDAHRNGKSFGSSPTVGLMIVSIEIPDPLNGMGRTIVARSMHTPSTLAQPCADTYPSFGQSQTNGSLSHSRKTKKGILGTWSFLTLSNIWGS